MVSNVRFATKYGRKYLKGTIILPSIQYFGYMGAWVELYVLNGALGKLSLIPNFLFLSGSLFLSINVINDQKQPVTS